jgi:hypothetical protein
VNYDLDSDQLGVLSSGTQLVPADKPINEEFGATYELCEMKVVATSKTGWGLKKWMKIK